ncbi:Fanconi anemia group J protein homolog [Clytia hemisphaerica]|uniref:DNA 5'-3' helicase n=1 Tax=Clytia hemisphaerica TaxID=252671 RepID=A0A7M5UL93_9CNID
MEMKKPKHLSSEDGTCTSSSKDGAKNSKEKIQASDRLPKIYFGTRTHKQIGQIIRELRKTVYKDARMGILGSREYLCIHPAVSQSRDKNEECKNLIKGYQGKSCKFHSNYHKVTARPKFNKAWDVEDLVTAGKKVKGCPYYASRDLCKSADVIFCPYNYLIDPLIRNQMMINLKDQIVVLDEAHNIEDSAREAGSVQLTTIQLDDTVKDLSDMISCNISVNMHNCLLNLCNGILGWINKTKDSLDKRGFENEAKVWTGKEMVKMLAEDPAKMTSHTLTLYQNAFEKLVSEEQDAFNREDDDTPRINTKSLATLSSIIFILEKLFDQTKDFAEGYRVGLCRTTVMKPVIVTAPGGWLRKSNRSEKVWTYKLNLWCLNPAVVFSQVGEMARTIVLTSGTLSPMKSFSSELGVDFPISLEANHVIDDSQVLVGNIGSGPTNIAIKANFQNSETFAFQDEVGKAVLQICKAVPKGVLCFLPSYSMMEKLIKRWKTIDLWNTLCLCKTVHSEPRGSDKADFDEILGNYYASVSAKYKTEDGSVLNGALLFAVCRGKVSEGLDFSDDNARAVIVVGIPFPNVKDIQVELKRKYNNANVSRGLLNGGEWYEMQAFRALNQAVGRCIRHRNDWGAIIMIDERFQKSPKYRDGLSKWVRGRFQTFRDFQFCLTSITQFVENQTNPKLKRLETSEKVTSGKQPIGYSKETKNSASKESIMQNEISTGNVFPKSKTECCISKACEREMTPVHTGGMGMNNTVNRVNSIGSFIKKRPSGEMRTQTEDEQNTHLQDCKDLKSDIRTKQKLEQRLSRSLRNKETLSCTKMSPVKNDSKENKQKENDCLRRTSLDHVARSSIDEYKTSLPEHTTNNQTASSRMSKENLPETKLSNQRKSLNIASRFVYPENKQNNPIKPVDHSDQQEQNHQKCSDKLKTSENNFPKSTEKIEKSLYGDPNHQKCSDKLKTRENNGKLGKPSEKQNDNFEMSFEVCDDEELSMISTQVLKTGSDVKKELPALNSIVHNISSTFKKRSSVVKDLKQSAPFNQSKKDIQRFDQLDSSMSFLNQSNDSLLDADSTTCDFQPTVKKATVESPNMDLFDFDFEEDQQNFSPPLTNQKQSAKPVSQSKNNALNLSSTSTNRNETLRTRSQSNKTKPKITIDDDSSTRPLGENSNNKKIFKFVPPSSKKRLSDEIDQSIAKKDKIDQSEYPDVNETNQLETSMGKTLGMVKRRTKGKKIGRNLRRTTRKESVDNILKDENHCEKEQAMVDDIVACKNCGLLLHSEKSLFSVPYDLPRSVTSSTHVSVFKVQPTESLKEKITRDLPESEGSKAKGFNCNSYYDRASDCVYIPLYCAGCRSNTPSLNELVGFQVISYAEEKETETFLFESNPS